MTFSLIKTLATEGLFRYNGHIGFELEKGRRNHGK